MTEKEMLLAARERELTTTLKVFKAFPNDKLDFKPHEISRTAQDLAWVLANEQLVNKQAVDGKIDFSVFAAPAPKTIHEISGEFETNFKTAHEAIKNASEGELNSQIAFGATQMRKIDVMWFMLNDLIHHRGQFSVYLRMAGGKVPAIYGPSFDEKGF